ncbi:MAG: alanine--tRNA ligase-related protein, partial [Thermomicrobiales bacterium]
ASTPLSGSAAFRLYDTYGFPLDLTIELAKEAGLSVDVAGFDAAMSAQQKAGRGAVAFKDEARGRVELYVSLGGKKTEFVGYDAGETQATITALVGPEGALETAEAGQPVEVILDRSPFYGESGGQLGDTGTIRTETGLISIDDTVKPTPDLFVHRGVVAEGFVRVGESAHAKIDGARRRAIRRNHTATHLLHRALRIVAGEETHQAGSLVAPDRLRFDFTSIEPLRPEQVAQVAEIVNREILADSAVASTVKPIKEAMAEGAMALFGEKYGDIVRLVAVEGFSKELCGGTHVTHTGEIGPFLISAESSVAAGVRRIEARTGDAAVERMLTQQRRLETMARDLRTPWHEVPAHVVAIGEKVRAAEREITRLRGQLAGAQVGDLLDRSVDVEGVRVLAVRVEVDAKEGLRQLADRLRDKTQSGLIALGAVVGGNPTLLVTATPDVVGKGVKAGDVVRGAAAIIGGRGGGRPDLAEAGGKDAAKLDDALAAVKDLVRATLAG